VVGPNGAGKTTLFKCLTGLESPMMGSIYIDAVNTLDEPRSIYKNIAYLAETTGIYEGLTVRQSLHYAASLHLMREDDTERMIRSLATDLDITERLDIKLSALSKGLRQSVALAQAIIHSPPIILLDEPASGLDPEARQRIINLFKKLQGKGATLLISTHVLSEIETYCSDLLIIKDGRLVVPETIRKPSLGSTQLRLKMSAGQTSTTDVLKINPHISQIEKISDGLKFNFTGNKEEQAELLNSLVAVNSTISSFEVIKENLQEKYLSSIKLENSTSHES